MRIASIIFIVFLFCNTDLNECTPNPCRNGGICSDGVGEFSCECTSGWSGNKSFIFACILRYNSYSVKVILIKLSSTLYALCSYRANSNTMNEKNMHNGKPYIVIYRLHTALTAHDYARSTYSYNENLHGPTNRCI